MKTLLMFSALVCAVAIGTATASSDSMLSQEQIEKMATHPRVALTDDTCSITGSVWSDSDGAIANAELDLHEVGGSRVIAVKTDWQGVYRTTIPDANHAVFVEANHTRTRVTGSRIPTNDWVNSTVHCTTGSVSIGAIETVEVAK